MSCRKVKSCGIGSLPLIGGRKDCIEGNNEEGGLLFPDQRGSAPLIEKFQDEFGEDFDKIEATAATCKFLKDENPDFFAQDALQKSLYPELFQKKKSLEGDVKRQKEEVDQKEAELKELNDSVEAQENKIDEIIRETNRVLKGSEKVRLNCTQEKDCELLVWLTGNDVKCENIKNNVGVCVASENTKPEKGAFGSECTTSDECHTDEHTRWTCVQNKCIPRNKPLQEMFAETGMGGIFHTRCAGCNDFIEEIYQEDNVCPYEFVAADNINICLPPEDTESQKQKV